MSVFESSLIKPCDFTCAEKQKILKYKFKCLFGPSWRADIIFEIDSGAKNPLEISKKIGGTHEPARRV